jgi:transposase
MTAATRVRKNSAVVDQVLFVAFELGWTEWKLGFTTGLGQKIRQRTIRARNVEKVLAEIDAAKKRFKLVGEAQVICCYEAGRDGFWLQRFLESKGIECLVVDSASIETTRRRRRVKTDRLDCEKLASMLVRYSCGDERVWSVVRVPSSKEEDNRQLHRELTQAKHDRTRVSNRIKGLLANHGLDAEVKEGWIDELNTLRMWDGRPLPAGLQSRLRREWRKIELCNEQINELQRERRRGIREHKDRASKVAWQLLHLKGIGTNAAWTYAMEFFAWRKFSNRKQVASLAGLAPTPHQSGGLRREQGISKAGNRYVRGMAIEIAWGWLRFQPDSKLSKWFRARFGGGGARQRKVGIVAVARKLLVDLWRYVETGAVPPGAALKDNVVVV